MPTYFLVEFLCEFKDALLGVEAPVDTTDGMLGALDLDEEDGHLEARPGRELRSVHGTSGGGDELTTSSVDSIGMEGNILEVESDTSHVLFDEDTFLGGPVEGSFHGVLNLVKVLEYSNTGQPWWYRRGR